jgi:hypothetical protein
MTARIDEIPSTFGKEHRLENAEDIEHALLHGGWEIVTKEELKVQRERD